MTASSLVFWLVVGLTVGSAFMVVRSQNLVYSAISLLFTLLGVAGLYVFLMADFIAVTQVMIYVGGILVLIIFGIMLTHKLISIQISHTSIQKGVGWVMVLLIAAGLARMVATSPWLDKKAPELESTVVGIGKLLMIDYLLPFEVASVLLLVALIGAAMLSRRT